MTTLTLSRLASTPVVEAKPSRLFATAHAALTFAYNHTDQVYDKPMMARMGETAGASGKGLGGTDGAGQSAYIFSALEKLPRLYRAILVARFAPRTDRCKCCQGTVDRHDWLAAVREISDAAACDALSAHPTPRVLRDAIVARYFGKDVKLSEAAERAGVSAATATNHNGKIKLWLYGTRTTKQKGGERSAGQKGVEALAMEYAADLLSAKGLCD
ncbi:hypothetical protein [Achromobacter kerstersii]|uniref:Uncharacterized protein n=1 Tax=Achromobacter kerstersii TaxID=1353890 RepID=A0A6S6ZHW3_9BURK|nr:hypothetical protein [Achromobacter kerstersii]CAB3680918.1 hypothetical protein LMG3441_01588 [Achromobacter kerstersii]